MCLFKKIAISNRLLCSISLEEQIKHIADKADYFILREKDLSHNEYMQLALKVQAACKNYHLPFAVNSRIEIARELGETNIHLPFRLFLEHAHTLNDFSMVGVSVHSVTEAVYASQHGADYVIAGHIFATDCKKNVPPRGLAFLKEICASVKIPIFAIGGITDENVQSVIDAGAYGACRMSWYMKNPMI